VTSKWPKGIAASDAEYARVAYLYTQLMSTKTFKTTERLAEVMEVSVSTAKERLRKARAKGFLTSPGKGRIRASVITPEAIKVLSDI